MASAPGSYRSAAAVVGSLSRNPPARSTRPSRSRTAVKPARGDRIGGPTEKEPDAGSNNSVVLSTSKEPHPPAIRTRPPFNSVAVWSSRKPSRSLPERRKLPVDGSKISAACPHCPARTPGPCNRPPREPSRQGVASRSGRPAAAPSWRWGSRSRRQAHREAGSSGPASPHLPILGPAVPAARPGTRRARRLSR